MNPPTPTLCLVMDGARIVSWEVVTSATGLVLPSAPYTLRTIPLSLCAIAPEMREAMKDFRFCMAQEDWSFDERESKMEAVSERALALLSRID